MAKKKQKKSQAEASTTEEDKAENSGSEWREIGLYLLFALLLVVLIKTQIMEVFVIPSGSMEPTLHGRPDGGDRVFCPKISYRFRETGGPNRWETFVFKFPYEQAANTYKTQPLLKFKGSNFIKRCVGLPSETIAISHGDVYVKAKGEIAFKRHPKSDEVIRSIWIQVYAEDLADIRAHKDFAYSWKQSGKGEWQVTPEKTLTLKSDTPDGEVHLDYLPRIPRSSIAVSTGITDRYILRQPMTFKCPNIVDGKPCGGQIRKTIENQKITAYCPRCAMFLTEKDVTFYGRRSDLPSYKWSIGDDDFSQGEDNDRGAPFNNAKDLRLMFRAKLLTANSELSAELQGELRFLTAVVKASGGSPTVEVHKTGKNPQQDILPPIPLSNVRVGEWFTVELYYVDGVARLFVNSTTTALLDKPVGRRGLPPGGLTDGFTLDRTGVRVAVRGAVELDDLRIDRDIYYLCGDWNSGRKALWGSGSNGKLNLGQGYMALGDNSPSSNDSRVWGAVPPSNLVGPAVWVWWPPHRIHPIQ